MFTTFAIWEGGKFLLVVAENPRREIRLCETVCLIKIDRRRSNKPASPSLSKSLEI
jgi:hypothetical protein